MDYGTNSNRILSKVDIIFTDKSATINYFYPIISKITENRLDLRIFSPKFYSFILKFSTPLVPPSYFRKTLWWILC